MIFRVDEHGANAVEYVHRDGPGAEGVDTVYSIRVVQTAPAEHRLDAYRDGQFVAHRGYVRGTAEQARFEADRIERSVRRGER